MRLTAENLPGRTAGQHDRRIQPVNAAITSLWRDDPKWHEVIAAASNDVVPMIVGELNEESFVDRGLDASRPAASLAWRPLYRSCPCTGWSLGMRFIPVVDLRTCLGEAGDWGVGLPLKSLISWTKRTALRYTILLPGRGSVSARRTATSSMRLLTSASSLKTRTWRSATVCPKASRSS